MATENKFLKVDHEHYDWSTETMSRVPADGTIWWYDDNGYIFSIVGNGSDDVETLRADQIEAYTQAVTKAGCQCDIDGEGYVSGDSTVVDHSGTQNPAIVTDLEPIDSKWGKMLHYNGTTSNLEFDNPVIGSTGTIRFILNKEDSVSRYLFDSRETSGDTEVLMIYINTTSKLVIYHIVDGVIEFNTFAILISILSLDIYSISFHEGAYSLYKNGDFLETIVFATYPVLTGANLFIGTNYTKTAVWLGDLSFNYTTEQFTAAQVKSDYNNPRKFSNEPVSQTPTAYTMSQHDGNGHTLMEFATKTATSAGNKGAIAFDATNVYFCIADSSWMTIPLESI